MTIGVLTTSYPRHADDWAGHFVAELAGWMARQGDLVEVIAPAPAATVDPAVRVRPLRYAVRPRLFYGAGAPDNLLGRGLTRRRVAAWCQVPGFVGALAATCWWRSRSWQRLVSHWLLPCGIVAGASGRGLPHLAVAHSSDVHLLSRLPGAAGLLRRLARPRSALVLTSEALREPLVRLTAPGGRPRALVDKAPVIPMAVRAVRPHRADPEKRRSTRTGPLRVICIGRLIALKGLDLLLQASDGLPLELVIVGDGPERGALERQARHRALNVRFLGQQGREETWRQLRASDVLVLPSRVLADGRTDSAPLALMEALVAGIPVVASRVGGVPSLVSDGVEGLTVDPGEVCQLRRALLTLIEDRPRRERMAASALRRGAALGWDKAGEQLRELLLAL